ncbi:hypothetical protein DVW87_14665 [Sphingomonas aracearum]|uniref:Uncharacterized protein n=2 Tax=Sphingomonas aracearum TaxID=2283317 RepID=A0A369VR06_9SPHN|nr:phage tail protein [Sphingomonas aracearum]RDE04814.1 hypothetical protein DVW87_14665 [Sphingomonas aracearum]
MATLVLSAVGTAIGGPIGGALGALLGQGVDREVLRPPGRQGPRLTTLAVQTSTYGTPIPRLFGRMRVAGSVIWATDLIESHATSRAGKGQPSVTTYSYSASFAVALSARAIRRVGRIWADGSLLRGAAGDLKVAGTLRVHPGGEDQAADPLIASAEGSMAPAHRGIAYAVFENLELAEFGNRLPSLTFEVFADEAPVSAGFIAAELTQGRVAARGGTMLDGFAAYGDSARGVLETLAEGGGWFAPAGDGFVLAQDEAPVATLADAGHAAEGERGARGARTLAAAETVPRRVTLAHYDPARDYQTGVQSASRPGAGAREKRAELPAAVAADTARALAERRLAAAEAARERRMVTAGLDRLALAPGAVVSIAGAGGRWRVTGWSLENMVLSLNCLRLPGGPGPVPRASPGRVLAAADRHAGQTVLQAVELPPLGDEALAGPMLAVLAAGTGAGWRRAALLYSLDGGARWIEAGGTAAPAVLGTVTVPPGVASARLEDRRSMLEVELAEAGMALADADAGGLMSGANLALVGEELLQFGRAERIGTRRWRLTRLWRGRRGTEAAIGGQGAGARFALLSADSVATIALPASAIGGTVQVMASGVGDAEPAMVTVAVTGASVLPPPPVALRRDGEVLRWTRRSRTGWRWIDGADAPLGEEAERYHVTLATAGGAVLREESVGTPAVVLAPAERGGDVQVTVRQIGTFGLSGPARIEGVRREA